MGNENSQSQFEDASLRIRRFIKDQDITLPYQQKLLGYLESMQVDLHVQRIKLGDQYHVIEAQSKHLGEQATDLAQLGKRLKQLERELATERAAARRSLGAGSDTPDQEVGWVEPVVLRRRA